ncbi:MAG: hypothetical protein WCX69_04380 [Candidatus Paceibacterota bacterium]
MSRKFRTFLFIFFVMVFAVGAPALVLYAQGYRLNLPFEPGKKLVVMTGGFFVKTTPKQANVFIDDKLEKQTDFFFGSALVENLLPRKYHIEVKKTGYQPWIKNLDVREKQVTEANSIILFPARLEISAAEKEIDGILVSPDSLKIALRQTKDASWNLKLYDIAQNITVKLADQNNFSAKNSVFADWKWIDSKTLGVSTTSDKTAANWTIAIDKNPARIAKSLVIANATSTAELASRKIEGGAYHIGQDGFIYKKDQQGNQVKIVPAQITVKPDASYGLWIFGDYYFVKVDSELFALKPDSKSFEKIYDSLSSEPKLSPDGKKIVLTSDSEIWVFFLKGANGQLPAAAENKIFIARFSEKIANCDWFNSDYLLFTAGGAIKVAEIDNRDKVNIVQLAKTSDISPSDDPKNQTPLMLWNASQKIIYLFSGTTLYKSQPIQ